MVNFKVGIEHNHISKHVAQTAIEKCMHPDYCEIIIVTQCMAVLPA